MVCDGEVTAGSKEEGGGERSIHDLPLLALCWYRGDSCNDSNLHVDRVLVDLAQEDCFSTREE